MKVHACPILSLGAWTIFGTISVFALRLKPLGNAGSKQIHEDLDVSFFVETSENQPSGFE